MTILDFIILLIVAAVCGSLGMAISGYSRGGYLVAIALRFIGALIGMWLARVLSLPEFFTLELGDVRFPIIWSRTRRPRRSRISPRKAWCRCG
jgi:uncharacterized membrane protein YeaQ/YmgE (transglycosylase-associated protein family)